MTFIFERTNLWEIDLITKTPDERQIWMYVVSRNFVNTQIILRVKKLRANVTIIGSIFIHIYKLQVYCPST